MTAIYGTAATGIGVVGIYQGRRAWVTRYAHHAGGNDSLAIS